MTRTYLFGTEKGKRFIINDERSGLGYAYPRIFVETPNGDYNYDTTLGGCFKMKPNDFESWLDGTEITGADLDALCMELFNNPKAKDAILALVEDLRKGE